MVEDDGNSSAGTASTPSSVPPSPRSANARATGVTKQGSDQKRAMSSTSNNGNNGNGSAVAHGHVDSPLSPGGGNKGKKRSFGQYDASSNNTATGPSNGSVHQSLRRALIDGGVGSRSNRSSPSVYSANSPFSTPGSSIPGTPLADDNDYAFAGPNGLSAFSALSLRPSNVDDHLPACAPPNLFFPAPGSSSGAGANSTTPGHPGLSGASLGIGLGGAANPSSIVGNGAAQQPPAKRERMISAGGLTNGPNGEKLDKDGKVIEKPFKCPNAGCDKAYKQANGLKYHRLHGSCNRNLAGSSDNSVSASSTPVPTSPVAASPAAAPAPAKPATTNGSNAAPAQSSQATNNTPTPKPAAPLPSRPAAAPTSNNTTLKPAGPQQPGVAASGLANKQPPAKVPNLTSPRQQQPQQPRPPQAGGGAGGKPPLPLPPNINSAALAAAAALLQRGGPLPASLQGQNGPIDTASLLKTLQMLQQQMAQQQGQNQGQGAGQGRPGAAAGTQNKAAPAVSSALKGSAAPATPGSNVAPGAPRGASQPTTATSGGGAPPKAAQNATTSVPGQQQQQQQQQAQQAPPKTGTPAAANAAAAPKTTAIATTASATTPAKSK